MGWEHFLLRGKEKVSGENALIMFSYNFQRLLNLIGVVLFQKLIVALDKGNIEQIKKEIAEYIAISFLYMLCFFKSSYIFMFMYNQPLKSMFRVKGLKP